ncbi:SILENCING MOVEMENT DEFICIENT 2, NUCLEAR RNA POLYMERASE D 1A, nuclear RNA polymerase D1A [Hibiscus trionum]|uniref:DNA-directed RNA polymerase n=1 Tax=Hibiscus trionum TaxID=183268 RepID=A0A9W7MRB9_HIBTR|nr:SILENCING MOVEMENT DEFICIENT 2, NUCLEAR RNA POLYMERASE D 1A, nuclear RNA polymerase D1A [Hibiscus trionum]
MSSMETELNEEQEVSAAFVTGIKFNVSSDADYEKMSVMEIAAPSEVSDPKLGFPNMSNHCTTCDARDMKYCEGHFGVIKFPHAIVNPYFLSEVVQILNKICPGCKSIRKDLSVKGGKLVSGQHRRKGCKYCVGNSIDYYPPMRFKISSKELFKKSAIVVEVSEKSLMKVQKKGKQALPEGYWDFIPKDQQQEDLTRPGRRVLSHSQVRSILKDVDPEFIKKFVQNVDSIFLNCFPVTPNSHRVTEIMHRSSNSQRLIFDERTRAYKKLVDFRGLANELSSHVLECLKISKVHLEKPSNEESELILALKRNKDPASNMSGLRYMKDVILGKRNDHCFRMVLTGNPNLKLLEIGIPCHVAERLQIAEQLNWWNEERLKTCCNLRILEKGEICIRREGRLVRIHHIEKLQVGDTIYRPLNNGDTVLINRPPSIHQHSFIALSVRVLPVSSVVSINPLICSPFRGDFDGDCFHGYVPQSIETRIELSELVSLNRQLINGQSGRNLLSLSHDSLTAAYMINEDGVLLNLFQMQQLEMFCPNRSPSPAIIKAPFLCNPLWTGKQLLSMLFPLEFDYTFAPTDVVIHNGELISSSEGSSWLRDADGNVFQSLIKNYRGKLLDFLHAAQEVLCEWLSMRGISVSLLDLYLSSDSNSRKNMMGEVFCGLQEAELTCNFKQLMADSYRGFLAGNNEETDSSMAFEVEHMCYEKQRSAAVSQASVDSFKQVFRDIQNLMYRYAKKDNSLLTMFKAGSKGNLLKLVQHSMCLGLQHSLVPLSFRFPPKLSCAAWNDLKSHGLTQEGDDTVESAKNFIPYAVVESSFTTGLNPLECFVHSVTSRESSFSDHADLPGTLSRRLMFFMRDICAAYDGTVRNAYGDQVVQFSYGVDKDTSCPTNLAHEILSPGSSLADGIGGQPVGSMSACAISEAAYSALDQPISLLETSPLLNLKRVLECGSRRSNSDQNMTLFLSDKLGRRRHGFEYAALEIKNHLERLIFSDIVSTVLITFSPQMSSENRFSPWICHFHVCEDTVKRKQLVVHSIIDSLHMHCTNAKKLWKIKLPDLQITSKVCDMPNEDDKFCITVKIVDCPKSSRIELDVIRDVLIPSLLEAVVKGFPEIKKVHILWKDHLKVSKSHKTSPGELYLRVAVSGDFGITNLWGVLMSDCLPVMDMIDWKRSHPDGINQFCAAYGIDAGWKFFLNNLKSAISDTGKTILNEHVHLVTNCLSITGEFVGLNSKGLKRQREHAFVSSPFMQACFSNPSDSFVRAAKNGVSDDLHGTIDALAWGRVPRIGTGSHFDIVYSMKDQRLAEPVDVYKLLGNCVGSENQDVELKVPKAPNFKTEKCGSQFMDALGSSVFERLKKIEKLPTLKDIQRLKLALKDILHKSPIDHRLSGAEWNTVMMALHFHPRRDEKIGSGAQEIKVGYHPEHKARCFLLERTDGTTVDFSYHKCFLGALEIIAPGKEKTYELNRSQSDPSFSAMRLKRAYMDSDS